MDDSTLGGGYFGGGHGLWNSLLFLAESKLVTGFRY